MKKYKICVYAIAKNEEQFVNRWVNSMKEADEIYVLDTGSSDKTVQKLQDLGVHVKQEIISPWRFDIARNISLDMVPKDYDICVCTDLDEVLEPGWRKELESLWKPDVTRVRYIYNWSLDKNNKPIISFYYEKIHKRKGYHWIFPVHEILNYEEKEEKYVTTDKIILNHYPDSKKSRSNYLELLKLSVQENPENDRNWHYLGREYMFHQHWNEAIDTLLHHLSLPTATWKDERAASMRFIARCYQNLNRPEEARMWLNKAIKESPYLRDAYVELALLEYSNKNFEKVYEICKEALKIKINNRSYINEVFTFDETVYDLLSISCFYLKKYDEALKNVEEALKINPENERIQNNKKLIENTLVEKNKIFSKKSQINIIDKNFYYLMTLLSELEEKDIFEQIKNNFLHLPKEIQISLEDYFKKFTYWGKLSIENNEYEEIEKRATSLSRHLDDFIWLYEHLKDYRSKKLLYAIINNWYQYDFHTLKECQENNYPDYFDLDIVFGDEKEVFVDLGAYIGDTTLDFIKSYNEKYKKIYCYEITDESFKSLKENLKTYHNLEFRKKAVGDENKIMYLQKNPIGNSANTVSDTGTTEIEVVTIDEDITEKITMIKMDIEGSEQSALRGCQSHIQKEHPKLLLSVYHNHEDIWKIPRMIEEFCPGYKFYLRYHGGNIFPTEVTLIAIYLEEK